MFFKNITAFRFSQPKIFTPDELEARLSALPFRHCGQLEQTTMGFTPPLGRHSEQCVHTNEGRMMICAAREDRLLPASVVNERVAEMVEEIELAENRKMGRKEKKEIQEKVMLELLPRAFAKSSSTYAYIDARKAWLILDTSSSNKAEEVVSLLRQAVESLPVVRPDTEIAPAVAMTQWLSNQESPEHFVLGDECSFVDPKSGALVRCKGKDLGSDEVLNHIETGMQVSQLTLTWKDRISFSLDAGLTIRKIKYLEGVTDAAAEIDAEDAAQRFDADFYIMTHEFDELLDHLFQAFGGEKKEK
jgi:recombination associated protein RdgC